MKKDKNNLIYYIAVFLFLIFILVPIIWCFIISISFEKDIFNDKLRVSIFQTI